MAASLTGGPPTRTDLVRPRDVPPAASEAPRHRTARSRIGPAWPLVALLAGFPVWWALGLANVSFILVAVPMAWQLRAHRPIRLPRGFSLWALFLLWVVLSAGALSLHAPGTLAGPASSRLIGYSLQLLNYLAQTVVLLWVGNLTEDELPGRRVVSLLGVLFLYTVAGGLLGLLAPRFSFTSPTELALPHGLATNPSVVNFVHPAAAQLQNVLGHIAPRPQAPFDYTNVWGGALSVLSVFFVLGWWVWGSRRSRIVVAPIALVALVPFIVSLNRGAWIGVGLMSAYVGVRLALRGRLAVLGALLAGLLVTAVVVFTTPLSTVVSQRLSHPASNQIRSSLSADAIHGALTSPIVGYGSSRRVIGSSNSITVGKTRDCHQCGNAPIGSNGGFWLILFGQGFVGISLFTGFFLVVIARALRDTTPLGLAATAVVATSLFYTLFYPAAGSALTFTMIAVALLWRNEQARRGGRLAST